MDKRISVSIVTYNSTCDVDKVMRALMASSALKDAEVYVVDNASSDGSADYIEGKYPFAKVIRLPKNVGFGQGHNAVLPLLKSKYHIIVNPDIEFGAELIAAMADFMDENPDISILTPKVLNDDGTEQFLPKKYANLKYLAGGRLERFGGIFEKWRAEYTMRGVNVTEPVEIDCCTGCFMFCQTAALKASGGFDGRYFLYFEDADLTREMKKYGKTVYAPQFAVTHSWKRENGSSVKGFTHALISSAKFMWKWRGEK